MILERVRIKGVRVRKKEIKRSLKGRWVEVEAGVGISVDTEAGVGRVGVVNKLIIEELPRKYAI